MRAGAGCAGRYRATSTSNAKPVLSDARSPVHISGQHVSSFGFRLSPKEFKATIESGARWCFTCLDKNASYLDAQISLSFTGSFGRVHAPIDRCLPKYVHEETEQLSRLSLKPSIDFRPSAGNVTVREDPRLTGPERFLAADTFEPVVRPQVDGVTAGGACIPQRGVAMNGRYRRFANNPSLRPTRFERSRSSQLGYMRGVAETYPPAARPSVRRFRRRR
jgi:hypothetical protein